MGQKKRVKWRKFMEWFRNIIADADILDYRYPIKGFGVWMPYGFQIRRAVFNSIRKEHDTSNHQEALFPLLVPDNIFQKEALHVKGFEDEVFWVTHGGLTPLDVKLALRPTSETAIYPMYKLWIRSHTDLPVRLYQVVNVFRHETKATRPMIRVREITSFKEAHTVHASKSDLEKQIQTAMQIYSNIFNWLGIPFLISRRPEWDKFAGAEYSNAFDTILPDGKTLQIGTVHNLGQNFSKTFDITFETEKGKTKFAYQSCYGISERIIAALLGVHGDDNGLVLPPQVAPYQVVIIPILFKKQIKEVTKRSKDIYNLLAKSDIRVMIDESDQTPGNKFYKWEAKGVPIRIEIGPRDLERDQVTIVRRDTFAKEHVQTIEVVSRISILLEQIQNEMRDAALADYQSRIKVVQSIDELKKRHGARTGISIIGWCGNMGCITHIEEVSAHDVLGNPLNWEADKNTSKPDKCLACGKPNKEILAVGRAY